MFADFQFSGLVLCYGPLALIIFGFIAFAYLTDGDARRTYLRRLDPRPDGERVDEPVVRTQPVTAQTPAGMVVTLSPTAVVPDDLQTIEGIGPKVAQVLQAADINTFSQLAEKSAADLRTVLDAAGMSGIVDPTTWPEQAKLAARGEMEALAHLQDRLQGGKRA